VSLGPRSKHKMSQRGERRTAHALGGKLQAGSGSQWHSKGDVRTPLHIVERKDTMAASYKLNLADLQKLVRHAQKDGRMPVMVVSIQGAEWALLPLTDLKALLPEEG